MGSTIQLGEAKIISENWKRKKGNNPDLTCEHETLLKEYYRSTTTGDYICKECGEAFTENERKNM